MLEIKNYEELLAHFGVGGAGALRREIRKRIGTADAYIVMESDGTGFTVGVDERGGDQYDSHFTFPVTEEQMAVGITEMELQANPAQAAREGEEFMLLMGEMQARTQLSQ